MAEYCLPKKYTSIFLDALRKGDIDPAKLRQMSSADRRAEFSKYLGEDNAKEVNTLFESKLLLKDQQAGMIAWAKQLSGLSEKSRKDIIDQIQGMENILNPSTEKDFLADLASKKLGATVSSDEAKQIFDLSNKAKAAKADMLADPSNMDKRLAYGNSILDLNDKVESFKPDGKTFLDKAIDVANIPKSMLTSILHFSAPFVQGWGMLSTARAWEGFGQMFKYFADESNYRTLQAYIVSHPDYQLAVDGKLGLTEVGDKLSTREEALQSTLVEKFNQYLSDKFGLPNMVRASGRAFTGYLNYVRFNRFADLINAARLSGEDVKVGSPIVRDIAKVVNDFTGRGAIGPGDKYSNIGPLLNTVFFSPRKLSATMQMFEPVHYLKLTPTARNAAIRQLFGSLIATGSVLGIAQAMGAKVSFNPLSADFAKIDINGEKLDMTGGNSIYTRLLARVATNRLITAKGEDVKLGVGYKPTTRAELISQYVRGKLSPIASLAADALYGSDPIGREFNLSEEAREKLLPITLNSFLDYLHNDPNNTVAIIPSLSAIFGVELHSPLPPMSKTGLTPFGDPEGTDVGNEEYNKLNQEFNKIGYRPTFPPQTINGTKLTDQQYHDYIALSGHFAKLRLDNLVDSKGWDNIPNEYKLSLVKQIIRSSRTQAQQALMVKSLGTKDDIFSNSRKYRKALGIGELQH